jgi:hypothetical protein
VTGSYEVLAPNFITFLFAYVLMEGKGEDYDKEGHQGHFSLYTSSTSVEESSNYRTTDNNSVNS